MTSVSHFRIAFVPTHFLAVFLPGASFAKRIAPAAVEPVIHQGVRYVAPNDDGRRAYVEAWDVGTNKKLWDLTVFTNRIDPKLGGRCPVGFHYYAEHPRSHADREIRARHDLPD